MQLKKKVRHRTMRSPDENKNIKDMFQVIRAVSHEIISLVLTKVNYQISCGDHPHASA